MRSFWEATGQSGRSLDFDKLCAFADEKGLQLIIHLEGSRHWQVRSLGSDLGTPSNGEGTVEHQSEGAGSSLFGSDGEGTAGPVRLS